MMTIEIIIWLEFINATYQFTSKLFLFIFVTEISQYFSLIFVAEISKHLSLTCFFRDL